jgi:hypothetical protein
LLTEAELPHPEVVAQVRWPLLPPAGLPQLPPPVVFLTRNHMTVHFNYDGCDPIEAVDGSNHPIDSSETRFGTGWMKNETCRNLIMALVHARLTEALIPHAGAAPISATSSRFEVFYPPACCDLRRDRVCESMFTIDCTTRQRVW